MHKIIFMCIYTSTQYKHKYTYTNAYRINNIYTYKKQIYLHYLDTYNMHIVFTRKHCLLLTVHNTAMPRNAFCIWQHNK